ncbi:MAG: triple tyrosine motif-containing protein, partial [Blastocatellia bacterium]
GLARYEGGRATVYTTKDGLAGNDVKIICDDRQGGLWLGSYGGLSHFKGGQFQSYVEKDGLPGDRVRSLYLDSDGTLWIGTYDSGLCRLKGGKFSSFAVKDGLFDDGVFQILEDDRANLWMSCNRGIYRVSKQQLNDFADGKTQHITCVSYGVEDGMLNAECNGGRQPAGISAGDGKLWFPTLDGVVVIDPDAVPVNIQPPPVLIESVDSDRAEVDYRGGVRISPGKQNLEIHYAGLSFIDAKRVAFKYRMDGLDADWIDAKNRRVAYYSHLPPGSYVFRVIAANSDGVWDEAGATLRVVVVPPIWRTWWFQSIVAFCIAAAVLLVYRRRVSQLEKANRAHAAFSRRLIESQEIERKRIAAELHDGLGQNLLVIKNRAMLGMADPD